MEKCKIFKYPLEKTPVQNVVMPKGAIILTCQIDNKAGIPTLWALVTPPELYKEKETENKVIEIFGTGHEIPSGTEIKRSYIGTVQDGSLVWHIFEFHGKLYQ
jgi:hypothetical protein